MSKYPTTLLRKFNQNTSQLRWAEVCLSMDTCKNLNSHIFWCDNLSFNVKKLHLWIFQYHFNIASWTIRSRSGAVNNWVRLSSDVSEVHTTLQCVVQDLVTWNCKKSPFSDASLSSHILLISALMSGFRNHQTLSRSKFCATAETWRPNMPASINAYF